MPVLSVQTFLEVLPHFCFAIHTHCAEVSIFKNPDIYWIWYTTLGISPSSSLFWSSNAYYRSELKVCSTMKLNGYRTVFFLKLADTRQQELV